MDLQSILEEIQREVQPEIAQGRVATYIPQLGGVSRDHFGMAVQTLDGRLYEVGDSRENFSVQSISKVFSLTMALIFEGPKLWERVGRDPSGSAFNSLVQLEYENGRPRNPFINAGALVLADVLLARKNGGREQFLDFVRRRSGNPEVTTDPEVVRSERETCFRNAAMANFLKSFGNLQNSVDDVLDLYVYQCSLAMNCVDLARGFLFLANHGVCPWSGERLLTRSQAKRINSLMLTCGTYDGVGDFAFRVGLPGKSGVGGGIVALIPNQLTVAVWSPGLDEKGNSRAGTMALELFTTKTGISIF